MHEMYFKDSWDSTAFYQSSYYLLSTVVLETVAFGLSRYYSSRVKIKLKTKLTKPKISSCDRIWGHLEVRGHNDAKTVLTSWRNFYPLFGNVDKSRMTFNCKCFKGIYLLFTFLKMLIVQFNFWLSNSYLELKREKHSRKDKKKFIPL